jgi:hypothetical protein
MLWLRSLSLAIIGVLSIISYSPASRMFNTNFFVQCEIRGSLIPRLSFSHFLNFSRANVTHEKLKEKESLFARENWVREGEGEPGNKARLELEQPLSFADNSLSHSVWIEVHRCQLSRNIRDSPEIGALVLRPARNFLLSLNVPKILPY